MVLLDRRHRAVEHPGLGVVVRERRRDRPDRLRGRDDGGVVHEAALLGGRGEGIARAEGVGAVGRDARVDGVLVESVPLVVVDIDVRAVDRQLLEVRAAEARDLRVHVGEQAGLQEGVVDDVDARHQVAGVEHDLLDLGEEVRRVGVQGQQADRLHGGELLGDQLGGVEQVDAGEHLVLGVVEDLDAQLPLREVTALDGVVQVAALEVGVAAHDELRLLPEGGVDAGLGLPVPLDQLGRARLVDDAEGVDAEALHRAQGQRQPPVGHVPQRVVLGLGVQRHEVP